MGFKDVQAITEFEWQVGSSLVKASGQMLVTLGFRSKAPATGFGELYFGFTEDAAEKLVEQMQALLSTG